MGFNNTDPNQMGYDYGAGFNSQVGLSEFDKWNRQQNPQTYNIQPIGMPQYQPSNITLPTTQTQQQASNPFFPTSAPPGQEPWFSDQGIRRIFGRDEKVGLPQGSIHGNMTPLDAQPAQLAGNPWDSIRAIGNAGIMGPLGPMLASPATESFAKGAQNGGMSGGFSRLNKDIRGGLSVFMDGVPKRNYYQEQGTQAGGSTSASAQTTPQQGAQQAPIGGLQSLQNKYQQMPSQYGSSITAYGQLGPKIGSAQTRSGGNNVYDPTGRLKSGQYNVNDGTNMYAGGGSQNFSNVTNSAGQQVGQTTYGNANPSAPFSQSAGSMSKEAQDAFNPLMQQAQKYGGNVKGFTAGPNGENGFGFALNPAQMSPEQNKNIFQQQHEILQNQIAQGGKLEASDAKRLADSKAGLPSWDQFGAGLGGMSAHRTWDDRGGGQNRSANPYADYQAKLDFMKQQQFNNQATTKHLENEGIAAKNVAAKPDKVAQQEQMKMSAAKIADWVKQGGQAREAQHQSLITQLSGIGDIQKMFGVKKGQPIDKTSPLFHMAADLQRSLDGKELSSVNPQELKDFASRWSTYKPG